MDIKQVIIVVLSVGIIQACAHTRVVKMKPGKGGEIAVHEGIIGDARADAKRKMKSNCGRKRAVVTEEGEAVVGSRSSSNTELTKWGSSSSSDTEDKREWRIKYRCS